jgi:lipopolysaccharide biosynthesis glycosyltransferase
MIYAEYFDNLSVNTLIKSLSFCNIQEVEKVIEKIKSKNLSSYEKIVQSLQNLGMIKLLKSDNKSISIKCEDFNCLKNHLDRFPFFNVDLSKRVKIVYCFNSKHFDGFITSIFSLINNNQFIIDYLDFNVFIDESLNQHQIDIIESLSCKIKISIHKIEEICSDFDFNKLKIAYGQKNKIILDKSAYYRIYALKFLTTTTSNDYEKIIYFDCDTLIVSSIIDLLVSEFDSPLSAHKDDYEPMVIDSMKKNRISNYFNSGVLVFNLNYKIEIIDSLTNCIEIIQNQQEKLFYHDQCALNISFNERWTEISDAYNTFIKLPTQSNDAKILHFIAAPKPWDIEFVVPFDSPYHKMWYIFNNMAFLYLSSLKKPSVGFTVENNHNMLVRKKSRGVNRPLPTALI